jgi:hypothetical protein
MKKSHKTMFPAMFSTKPITSSSTDDADNSYNSPFHLAADSTPAFKYSGFLSVQIKTRSSSTWSRYYFVIRGPFGVYYKSKEDFDLNPNNPINGRPISFDGYSIDVQITEISYCIILTPSDPDDDRKTWEFRCDTQTELDAWVAAFTRAAGLATSATAQSSVDRNVSGSASVVGGSTRFNGSVVSHRN